MLMILLLIVLQNFALFHARGKLYNIYCCFFAFIWIVHRIRYFLGDVLKFNQSEARKQCFVDSDWLKFETRARKHRNSIVSISI